LLDGANTNTIHHNNFVKNTVQIYVKSSYGNIWDNGYPSGGNYWSDYGGLDQFGGLYQNVTGSDGIGDTLYMIDANNRDNYPLMGPWNPNAGIWTVDDDGPADFRTIQEAINAANGGDAIFVEAGIYYEHVFVNKTLSLLGEDAGATIVDGSGSGNVFTIDKNNITITGFTIRNSGTTLGNAGMRLNNANLCSISGNSIRDNFAGLWLEESSENLILENNITANVDDGIVFNYSHNNTISGNHIAFHEYFGIVINWSHNNTICYNNVTQTYGPSHGDGLNLWRSSSNNIFQNRVEENNRYGIRIETQSNNNTLSENTIRNCTTGLQVYDSSSYSSIIGNSITGNTLTGVSVERYSDNNTISGNTITGGRFGVSISNSKYTGICDNTIAQTYGSDIEAGVYLESAGYTKIYENEIIDNWRSILVYASSPYVSVHGNNITNNEHGIAVARGGSDYFNVSENYVANNRAYGIALTGLGGASNYATVARNLIVNNTLEGVGIGQGSSYNMVLQNNIVGNGYGIYIDLFGPSTQNTIFNNNIINNTQQVRVAPGSVNTWDGGYLLGGNYWSNYAGVDVSSGPYQNETGSDGIGDTTYVIDANNIDRYPLKGMFFDHEATSECHVQTICSSTLSDFQFNGTAISFNVSGENGTAGFCRICIPTALVNATYRVLVNGTEVLPSLLTCSNATHSYLYFNYTHSTKEVVIVPEYPLPLVLLSSMTAILLAAAIGKRRKRTFFRQYARTS
jgi:parallel beta-helix repeat protein